MIGKVVGVVLIIAVALIAFLYFFSTGMESVSIHSDKCELSLCDCECYPAGETPEEKSGKICGNNCEAWKNVTGCLYVSNETGSHCVATTR